MTWLRNTAIALVFALPAITATAGGEAVSDFTLRDLQDQKVTLSEHKDEVVLLQFWATYCGPCKVEMKHLNEMYNEMKAADKPFVVLSVNSDDARMKRQVERYIAQKQYTFPVLLDQDSSVTGHYNPNKTLPYNVLIGKDHTIAKRYSGYNPGDEKKLHADVEAELAK
mgnify:CR=1 FL=1